MADDEDEKKKKRLERREKRKAAKTAGSAASGQDAAAEKAAGKEGREKKRKKKDRKKNRRLRKKKKNTVADSANPEAAASDITDDKEKKKEEDRRKRKAEKKSKPIEGDPTLSDGEKHGKKERRKERKEKKKKGKAAQAAVEEYIDPDSFPMQRLHSDDIPIAFTSIAAIDLSIRPQGRFSVESDGVVFQTYFEHAKDRRLFVLLGGAVPKNRKAIQQFERRGWGALMPGSILCIADPTLALSDELSLGWYIGTKDKDYTAQMARLVDRVASELQLQRSDIVFYASSGGGFAALMCAKHLPGSNCLVVNPQIDLSRHDEPEKKLFAKFFAGEPDFDLIAREHGKRVSVLAAFPDARNLPPTVYVQNSLDESHFKTHFEAFCEAYDAPKEGGISANGRILTQLFEHTSGHGPEPRQIVRPLIAQALAFFDHLKGRTK